MSHIRNDVDALLMLLSNSQNKEASNKIIAMRKTYNTRAILDELRDFSRAQTNLVKFAIAVFELTDKQNGGEKVRVE